MTEQKEERENYEKGPCGCQMWTVGDHLYYQPCSARCPNYLYAMNVAEQKGVQIVEERVERGERNEDMGVLHDRRQPDAG